MKAMIVANYMTNHVHSLSPEHSLAAAHRLMRRNEIRHLPILEDGKLVGMVSQRDLYFLESLLPTQTEDTLVSVAMEKDVLSVEPSTPIVEVVRTMIGSRVGSLIVMEDGKVCGIFTTIDALMALWEMTDQCEEANAKADSGKTD